MCQEGRTISIEPGPLHLRWHLLLTGRELQIPGFGEGLETAVVSAFDLIGEAAGRQLLRREMIAEAFATHAFLAAARVGTIAVLEVLLFLTFHVVVFSF
jgi:hypothetical protein